MRIALALFSFIFLLDAGKSPFSLENTRWQGIVNAPAPMKAELDFRKDSSFIWVDNSIIETMHYTVSGDTLVLTKLNGSSPCSADKGVYRFTITGNLLKIIPLNDACHDRVAAWDAAGYRKK